MCHLYILKVLYRLKGVPGEWGDPVCRGQAKGRKLALICLSCLQWTPKDDWAALKLHGKCDDVMQLLMDELGLEIPVYNR